jgi:signal transduction histidine kinase
MRSKAAPAPELRVSLSGSSAAEARRRLERDPHDAAQQRFVSAAVLLELARRRGEPPA